MTCGDPMTSKTRISVATTIAEAMSHSARAVGWWTDGDGECGDDVPGVEFT